jgi:rusticyanin
MNRTRLAAAIAAAALAAAGLGAGVAIATSGPAGHRSQVTSSSGVLGGYSWYTSMMGRRYGSGSPGSMMGGTSGGSMMGSGYRWMMGGSGYRWMTGGLAAPAWMRGHALPGFMMGTSGDPGKIMGSLFAGAPGPRVSPAQAARLGSQAPAGATVNRAANRITFSGATARLAVLASPAGGPDMTFRIAGLVNPAIVVKAGTRVSIEFINADPDTAHGLVVTAGGRASSWMPMMTARPAFPGAARWFLGNPTAAGMHAATLTFTARASGHYRYLCPVPGHTQKGMAGSLIVT